MIKSEFKLNLSFSGNVTTSLWSLCRKLTVNTFGLSPTYHKHFWRKLYHKVRIKLTNKDNVEVMLFFEIFNILGSIYFFYIQKNKQTKHSCSTFVWASIKMHKYSLPSNVSILYCYHWNSNCF